MKYFLRTVFATLACLLATFPVSVSCAEGFELRDGDRVVLLGDGLIEQEQYFGWVEVAMTTAFPERHVTFRNLGWSADTPAGDSRFGLSLLQAGYEPADEGWKQLQKQLQLTKPSVIVLGYGLASALEGGDSGIDQFTADYKRLLSTAEAISPGVRFVLLSPILAIGDAQEHNRTIASYADAVSDIAKETSSPFVDLTSAAKSDQLRKDPIHLNDAGYREIAGTIGKSLGLAIASNWRDSPFTEALRTVILRKSEWWFHRSRPANMAYVFGFRKHEQGQNAVEIPRFDVLIEKEEQLIASLRKLQPVAVQQPEARVESQYAKFTKQPTPEFTVGDGFEVNLWAENPQLNKPIQMNFDPEGRLWVASSEAYPMIEVGQSAPDKILVLEDTTGDGKADKSTVFADGLLIPTGVEPGEGGVYVAQSTDLLFLKDTDGDGKADVRRRVLSGFGTEDTHHNLHTLRWGFDGRLYMNQSIYTRTDAETPKGIVRLKAGGGFRYDTDSMQMQIFFRGLVNSWGHQFDRFGQSFLTDGAGFSGMAYSFPGAAFAPTPGARRLLGLISPGRYPKFASMEVIYGDTFPEDWQGSIVTCDFRANRLTRFSLQDQDAGFVTRQEDDILRTSAATFRPIDVKQGPDGAMYIADWSNPIINHGEVDFRDERRDRWHGRIWRVTWKGAKAKKKQNLRKLSTLELLDNLIDNDRYTRDQSRRVLFERGEFQNDLNSWIAKHSGNDEALLEAAWMLQGIRKSGPDLLGSSDPRVRTAAVRIFADSVNPEFPKPMDWDDAKKVLEPLVVDDHPRVRLEAIRTLGLIGTAESASLALKALSKPMDRFIEYALATTIDECGAPLMAALESGAWSANTPAKEKQLEFILTSIDPARAGSYLSAWLKKTPITKDGAGPWIELVGKAGSDQDLRSMYDQLAKDGFDPKASVRVLRSIDDAARLRKKRPGKDFAAIEKLVASSTNPEVRRAAVHLAGTLRLGRSLGQLKQIAMNDAAIQLIRMTAIDSIREIGGGGAANMLAAIAESGTAVPVRQRAVVALSSVDAGRAADLFLRFLKELPSEDAALVAWRGMLGGKNVGNQIAQKINSAELSPAAVSAGLRACKDGGRNEPKLLAALAPLAGVAMKQEELTPERIKEMIQKVGNNGNPGRGESVYARKELACVNCHAIGGVGGKVGPDMTSLGASAPIDYIIESLYDPNAKIKEGYHAVTVATDAGQVYNGIVVEDGDTELVLRSAENKLVRIPQAEIVVNKPGKSLMPTGVIDRLTSEEQIDLICFLTKLGKPGNYDASKGGVARVYEVFAGTHRIEQNGAEKIIQGEIKEGWKPLQSRVNGNVFGNTLRTMTQQPVHIALVHVYLRTRIEASNDVSAKIDAVGADSVALWIDGHQLDGKTSFTTDIKKGYHTLVARLDARDLPKIFKLLSSDVTFATEIE